MQFLDYRDVAALNFFAASVMNCLDAITGAAYRGAAMVLPDCRDIAALPRKCNAAIIAFCPFRFLLLLVMVQCYGCLKYCKPSVHWYQSARVFA